MKINQKELQLICEELMEKLWNDKLEIPVEISSRMTRCLGSFTATESTINGKKIRNPEKITISKKLLETHSLENIEGVIKHELCHYYLFKTYQKYSDGDKRFQDELKRIGAHSTRTLSFSGDIHLCKCSKCGRIVKRSLSKSGATRTINNRISGCCKADIVYAGVQRVENTNSDNVNYKPHNNITVIHKYTSGAPSEQLKVDNNINNKVTTKLTIDDIIAEQKEGGIKAKVYRALISAIQQKSAERINLIATHYPDRFAYECIKFSQKRMDYINSVLKQS